MRKCLDGGRKCDRSAFASHSGDGANITVLCSSRPILVFVACQLSLAFGPKTPLDIGSWWADEDLSEGMGCAIRFERL